MMSSLGALRKLERKLKKCMHTVEKETGIMCSTTSSKNVVICNAGLITGLSQEVLVEQFSPFGCIESIVMPQGKSCSFLTFNNENAAADAYKALNGKATIAQDEKPVYLAYSEEVPKERNKHLAFLPPGLVILTDFVTESEENLLINLLRWDENNCKSTATLKNRQVLHFGYEFKYSTNNVDKNCPLPQPVPEECNFIFDRLGQRNKEFADFHPDQLTVNKYDRGHGIPAHVDTHSAFEDPILSLSLGSSIVMDFKKAGDEALSTSVYLPRRSLLVMSGEARYLWTHAITPRKSDVISTDSGLKVERRQTRTSFTFRKVLRGECECDFSTLCDSFAERRRAATVDENAAAFECDENVARDLESLHVHRVYENIASHFSDTRHKPWPNVLEFVVAFDTGSILIDVGCGNGKYLAHNDRIFDIGCDRSFNLIDVCSTRGFEVFTCNCLHVPLCDGSVDGAISIAVIHHLANESRRLQAVKEMVRVLRPGGRALIYVWAKEQRRAAEKSAYLKQDRRNRERDDSAPVRCPVKQVAVTEERNVCLPIHTNRTQFVRQDMLVPWKLKKTEKVPENETTAGGCENAAENEVFLRYYHVFEEGELENLCRNAGENVRIVKSYYDQGNWCAILEKSTC